MIRVRALPLALTVFGFVTGWFLPLDDSLSVRTGRTDTLVVRLTLWGR